MARIRRSPAQTQPRRYDNLRGVLTEAFKNDPTIEYYLDLRRRYPRQFFDLSTFGGINHVIWGYEKIGKYGIDRDLYLEALDLEPKATSELCLKLIENMKKIEDEKKSGRAHLSGRTDIIPQHVSDWIIASLLGSLSEGRWKGINFDLLALLLFRISKPNSRLEDILYLQSQRQVAAEVGGVIEAQGDKASYRLVANAMCVAPSTVKRWFKSTSEFRSLVKEYYDAFVAKPERLHKFLKDWNEGALRED